MKALRVLWAVAALATLSQPATAQVFSARRMAMGGVILSGTPGGSVGNVAYRAVPAGPDAPSEIPVPLGLIALIADPPVLDPDDPEFNVYELANTLYNPPWNLHLTGTPAPSSDITIAVGENSLAVDLGEIADVFPSENSRVSGVFNGPTAGLGWRGAFVAVAPLVHYDNDLSLNDALHGALGGEPFTPQTEYALFDHARGQAAIGFHAGMARRLFVANEASGAPAFYAGARLKWLRGLAYGDADNRVGFTTTDTLFANDPVDINYLGMLRDAGPDGGGFGVGADLGVAWTSGGLTAGLGVNDVGTRLRWRVRESLVTADSAGDYSRQTLRDDVAFTSSVPATGVLNLALATGPWLIAADVTRGPHATTTHAGVERWWGPIAARTGLGMDEYRSVQFGGGVGVRFGRAGLDLGATTQSRNLSRERGVDLAVGVAWYPPAEAAP
jgi:hypothetical protein